MEFVDNYVKIETDLLDRVEGHIFGRNIFGTNLSEKYT